MDKNQDKMTELIEKSKAGDNAALEALVDNIQDAVFNLSLRMLGTIHDAEDASQEIIIKVITHLSQFRGESLFTTWVFSIASNHLQNYKKSMFAARPLSFEYYGTDIMCGREKNMPDMSGGVDTELLEKELKLSCTNVMLQCLDAESRCIYILGTMFKVDSRIAGEMLNMSPEAYRQRLSRIRKKMSTFLDEYCGLSGKGHCSCKNRINYAVASHRLNPESLEYSALAESEGILCECMNTMEKIDDLSSVFSSFPAYKATQKAREFLDDFLKSDYCSSIVNA